MSSLVHDLRIAVRTLLRQPGFAIAASLTLALGTGGAVAIFSVVHAVLLRPLPYPQPERLAFLWQTARDNPRPSVGGSTSHVNFLDWQRSARSFEAIALFSPSTFTLSGLGEAEVVPAAIVTPGFFEVFRAAPVLGRGFTPHEDLPTGPEAIVVSHGFWKERLGGRADALGQTLTIGGRPRPIVGVAAPGFDFPSGARLWMPVKNDDDECGRACVYLDGVARLREGVGIRAAQEEMAALARRLGADYPDENTNVTIGVRSLQDQLVGDVRVALVVLLAAVLSVLAIGCANVANLLLARGAARRREVAIRAAMGAGRAQIARTLLAEALTLAVAGTAAGLLLAVWLLDLLSALAPAGIPRLDQARIGGAAVLFALGLAGATTALFGLGPALQQARGDVAPALAEDGRTAAGTPRSQRVRRALVAAQIALSLALLVGSGLLVRTVVRIHGVDPGWSARDAVVLSLAFPASRYPDPAAVTRAQEQLRERFAQLPGVEAVGRIWGLPLGPSENVQSVTRADRPAPPPALQPVALYRVIDERYLPTLGIPIVEGRNFARSDNRGSVPVVVVSRLLASRYWPGESPVGRQVRLGSTGDPMTIVGVAGDVRSASLTAAPRPEMYVPQAQTSLRAITFVLRGRSAPAPVLNGARAIVREFDATLPLIHPGTLADLVDAQLARPRFYLLLLGAFAALALVLAVVGLYGVVAYLVSLRTREVAIRMVLGAGRGDVVRLMAAEGLGPTAVGVVLGWCGALVGARYMAELLYETPPRDPWTWIVATAGLVAVAVVASVVPAARASRIPQALALRAE